MYWRLGNRASPAGNVLAKRHYNCQSPDSGQFAPPGRCVVLVGPHALWVTSWPYPQYVKHAWPGAWVNSLFRREQGCPLLASELIRQAVAATLAVWPDAPAGLGIVTFVDAEKVRHKRDPGRCYRKAGWTRLKERTAGGLIVYQQLSEVMPAAERPVGFQLSLLFGRD